MERIREHDKQTSFVAGRFRIRVLEGSRRPPAYLGSFLFDHVPADHNTIMHPLCGDGTRWW
jgi:hypothetical protein